jgi:sulfatase maturation enzyme AslB (radical SAM superfamily)
MHYNSNLTNLTWKSHNIPQILEFNQPSIQASLDGTHETLEYTRDGAKWSDVEKNWKEYYKYLNKNGQMGIASVLHSPVILDIDRWFDFFEQYDILIYNHRFFHSINTPSAFLDTCLFPKHIFDRVIGHAIDRFKSTGLRNGERSVAVLESYIQDRQRNIEYYNNPESAIECKTNTIHRDKYLKTKRSYGEVLKIVDQEAFEWYDSLPIRSI